MPDGTSGAAIWGARLLTFFAVLIAWVFFRAESFGAALRVIKGMVGFNGITLSTTYQQYLDPLASLLQRFGVTFTESGTGLGRALVLMTLLWVVWCLPNSQELLGRFRPALEPMDGKRIPLMPRAIGYRVGLTQPDGSLALSATTGAMLAVFIISVTVYQAMKTSALQQFIYFQF